MIYELEAGDFPSFEEVKEAAQKHFVEVGRDPGEYQGFMAGCKWLYEHFNYKTICYKNGEWIEGNPITGELED